MSHKRVQDHFAGPLLYGFTTVHYGAQISLLISAIGIGCSLLLYHFTPIDTSEQNVYRFYPRYFSAAIFIIVLIALTSLLLTYIFLLNFAIWIFCTGTVGLIVIFSIHLTPDQHQRKKLYAYLVLNAFAILFYAGYMQSTSSMLLFVKRDVSHTLFNHVIPTASFASLGPLFIILLASFIAPLWAWLTKHYHNNAIILRCALGLILGAAFLLILAFAGTLFAYLSDQQTHTLDSAQIYAHSYYLIASILAASILLIVITSRWIKSAVN